MTDAPPAAVPDGPVVVGVNRTQDGSIALALGTSTVYSLQKERVSRRKHHWGRLGDVPNLYLPRMPLLAGLPVDLVVEGYSSDAEIANLDAYHAELRAALRLADGARIVRVSHHLTHLYSAFHPSPFDVAAGLVVDAQGSRLRDLTEPYDPPPGADGEALEVSSFYRCGRGRVVCLAKQLWDGDWTRPAGLGCFYALLTKALWPAGEGNEGKVMGLAPYGDPEAFGLPPLDVRGHEVHIPPEWLKVLADRETYVWTGDPDTFRGCADLAAAGQRAFEDALMALVSWLHGRTGLPDLVFAGGCGLNCSANGRILRSSPFRRVFVPPSPHDGGTAIGCAIYGLVDCLGVPSGFRWEDDFLGPDPDPDEVERAVAGLPPGLVAERPDDLAGAMVDLLAGGRVVALHQGRSESGPRALGNRSIVADPRLPEMQDYVNFEVKGREWFRPLAPLVLAEHAARIFDVDRPAPFMQYAADVRPPHRDRYPGITHVDGTARLQTVECVHTPFLHALLTAWHARTGSPVLVNTSLNGPGDPLTETPAQSVETLRTTGMHALAMPPYLVRKVDEPPVPGAGWRRPPRPG